MTPFDEMSNYKIQQVQLGDTFSICWITLSAQLKSWDYKKKKINKNKKDDFA